MIGRALWDDLDAAWRAWASAVAQLPDEDWARPTRLPGWTAADLVAHHAPVPGLLHALVLPRASSRIGIGPLLRVAGLLAAMADPVEFIEAATGQRVARCGSNR